VNSRENSWWIVKEYNEKETYLRIRDRESEFILILSNLMY